MFKSVLGSAAYALTMHAVDFLKPKAPHHYGRTRYSVGQRGLNRSKYMPHQGKREIARRLRQEARRAAKAAAQ